MGYIRHQLALAIGTSYGDDLAALTAEIDQLRAEMRDKQGSDESHLLIGPIPAAINAYNMFALLPDGSKWHWDTSDRFNGYRERFAEIIDRQRAWELLTCEFGGDEPDLLYAALSVGGHTEAARRVQPAAPPANTGLWS